MPNREQAELNLKAPDYVHVPAHPKFKGKCEVLGYEHHQRKDLKGPKYSVDLTANICSCSNGADKQWHGKHQRWEVNVYCSHKLRAMADILEREGRPVDMQIAYAKALAGRYNAFEVVSAFHKELRRGDIERAMFWGTMLANFRKISGVNRYLLNILYEETRDHTLGRHLLDTMIDGDANDYDGMCRNIVLFCRSKKKWELPHRMKYLQAEMDGYKRLIEKYGRDVAKGGNIIDNAALRPLMDMLLKSLRSKVLADVQYALKGLQKLKVDNIDQHRANILNMVHDKFIVGTPVARRAGYNELYQFIGDRAGNGFGIGYHELNAYIDFVCGETYAPGLTDAAALKTTLQSPPPKLRLGVSPLIPLYAQDNHTWAGKALIRRFPNEWVPGAVQEHMDLRLCGAYIGVVYRHLAFQQFGRIDCNWEQVGWPNHLSDTVSNLWY